MGVPSFKDVRNMVFKGTSHVPPTNDEMMAHLRSDYKAKLAQMEEEDKLVLSPRTLAERKAGRKRLVKQLRESIGELGKEELGRRFKSTGFTYRVDDNDQITLQVYQNHKMAKPMEFSEHIVDFPSEMMIAQVTLLVG